MRHAPVTIWPLARLHNDHDQCAAALRYLVDRLGPIAIQQFGRTDPDTQAMLMRARDAVGRNDVRLVQGYCRRWSSNVFVSLRLHDDARPYDPIVDDEAKSDISLLLGPGITVRDREEVERHRHLRVARHALRCSIGDLIELERGSTGGESRC